MDQNQERSVDWVAREGHSSEAAIVLWGKLHLAQYPPGLDYYVLDCSMLYGMDVCFNWLGAAIGYGGVYHNCASMAERVRGLESSLDVRDVIEKMDASRRRRVRMARDWNDKREAYMNRLLRVKKRALKLMESPGEAGMNGAQVVRLKDAV